MQINAAPYSYDEEYKSFRWKLPRTFNFGRDVVDRWASTADKEALVCVNEDGQVKRYRFSDISKLSSQVANMLARLGVKRGDRVLVMLPRWVEWQISIVACMKIGAIPIPSVTLLTAKDVRYRANHSEAVCAITTIQNTAKFEDLPSLSVRIVVNAQASGWVSFDEALTESESFDCADLDIEEPALLYYTSGSTGNPKGVMHAARGVLTWPVAVSYWMGLRPQDTMWSTADTGWGKAATGVLLGPWQAGACVLFYDGGFDPRRRLELIVEHGVTVFCATATEFRHFVQIPAGEIHTGRLRLAASGGESVNPEVSKQWTDLTKVPLLEAYGQTESLMTIINSAGLKLKPGSMGKSAPGTHSAVITSELKLAKPGEIGQIVMKLPVPQMMLGYYKDPAKTAESTVEIDGQKYWQSGDLGYQDEEGYFFYSGRGDDIIGSAGYRIGPTEVENALIEHPAVLECAAVGSPDAERGEIVKAFVVLRAGFEPSDRLITELQDHTKRTTAPYKYPRKIEFANELPKNAAGKIMRRVLRDQEYGRV